MLILNTLSILVQVAFIVFMSFVSMNVLRYFTGPVRKMAYFAPALFVNHGGGPLPLLGDPDHKELTKHLRDDVRKHLDLSSANAIILVTAHWEESVVTISSGKKHNLYFDYYGFPSESYKYKYDAPGHPELAERIHSTLKNAGIKSKLDDKRGWDHGVFVPMMLINPTADVPIVQLSVMSDQDPEEHYKLGEVLYEFRKEGVAVVGSGMSYHNMRAFMSSRTGKVVNSEFDDYLNRVCTEEDVAKRKEGLINWRQAPGATDSHPTRAAEHFMPLIVAAGAGGPQRGIRVFHWDMSKTFRLSGFVWQGNDKE